MKIKFFIFLFLNLFFLQSCGWKQDPTPLFPTSQTAIDQEIARRKKELKDNNTKEEP